MARGACLCGAVGFEVEPPYRWFAYCHCSMCRIHHGALFGAGVGVDRARFEWRSGRSAVSRYRASSSFERPFCRHCGSKVPAMSHLPDVMLVPAGALEDFGGKPRAHIFAASKSGVHEIADGLPRFDAYPPGVDLPVLDAPEASFPVEASPGEPSPGEPSPDEASPDEASRDAAAPDAAVAGRCLCGEVGYALGRLPQRIVHCHCSLCRRSRGAPFSTTSAVPADLFWWTRGEEAIGTFRMAPPRAYGTDFCLQCGSLLPSVSSEGGLVFVPTGALSMPPQPLPAVHLHVGSKAEWDVIADGWPQFDEAPPEEQTIELI